MKHVEKVTAAVLLVTALCVATPAAAGEEGTAAEPLKIEHLAFANAGYLYMDGPRLEAGCAISRPGTGLVDDDGNVWFGGRCLVKGTGLVRPFFGDDYWTGHLGVDEGPGSALLDVSRSTGLGQRFDSKFLWGAPMKGGDKGFILFSDGVVVRKVFKNPEKNDRWWFRKIIGEGSKPIPHSKGGTVPALDADFRRISMVQVMPDGRIILFAEGSFYEYKDENLVCLLGKEDYRDNSIPKRKGVSSIPAIGLLGGDGTFYLGTYFGSGYSGRSPCIWRIVPGGKLEPYAWAVKNGLLDGPAMASGAHCGHHFFAESHNYKYMPSDCMYVTAHDEGHIRRIRNGRVSTLCKDGEWRERLTRERKTWWFNGGKFSPGPGGMATGSSSMHSHTMTMIVTGIDFHKPTSGPRIEAAIPAWPPENVAQEGNADEKGGE